MATTATHKSFSMLARATSAFGIDFLKALRDRSENLAFSPLCVETVLGMTWVGAQGETRRQLAQVAHFPEGLDRVGLDLAAVLNGHGAGGADEVQFCLANAFFVQQGLHVRDTFLQALSLWGKSPLFGLDFARDARWAGARINQWVEGETQGGIRQLIPPDAFDSLRMAVLVSALYFKGLWAEPFVEQATRREPFWLNSTESMDVSMMHVEGRFDYMETHDCQVLELPYQGGVFSMLICLPRQKEGLRRVEQSLAANDIPRWLGAVQNRQVCVSLPRFSVRMDGSINEPLKALGLRAPFEEEADFRGITTDAPLMLSDVFHGTLVKVTETGTVASAGCAACFGVTMCMPDSAPPVVFNADNPFLFALVHRETGIILFLGHIQCP